MVKVKKLSFLGETIYCGLDAHKTNWKVNIRNSDMELSSFSQDPCPNLLNNYLRKNYPDAELEVVYEAGFCGFEIQRSLTKLGIKCIVVNAADVPGTDKDYKRKDDKRDARRLAKELSDRDLKGIYIPGKLMEHARSLVRQRHRLVQDQTRCKNRIKHMLMFSGIKIPEVEERWNKKYITQIQTFTYESMYLKSAVELNLEEYLQIRRLLTQATRTLRKLSLEPLFSSIQKFLRSVPAIGLINGMVIQTELQDISRFKTLDSLCDYAGFVPDIRSTNDKKTVIGVTKRCNEFLREALIESSWMLIRKDPAMLMKYNEYKKRMNPNKAIIRIGKHLLSRIRYVWSNQKEYEIGLV